MCTHFSSYRLKQVYKILFGFLSQGYGFGFAVYLSSHELFL